MAQGGKGGAAAPATGFVPGYAPMVQAAPPSAAGRPAAQPATQPAGRPATQPAGQQMYQGGYGINPMNNSAMGFADAFKLLTGLAQPGASGQFTPTQAATYKPTMAAPAQTYNAATAPNTAGYNAAVGQAARYNAATAQANAYNAAMQAGPQTIASQMGRYVNPYESQVVNRTARQMQDALAQTQNANADAAIAAGAFGGGRHGVVEGVSNAEAVKNIGDMTAQLRHQGFDTAASLAGQDVANRMDVNTANQNALNAQRQYNTGAINDMRQYNANALNTQRQYNAGSLNDMNRFNAGAVNQSRSENAAAVNQRNAMNASIAERANQYNMDAINANRQFNATQGMGYANQNFNNMMGLANALGNMSQASYNVGSNIAGNQMQAGGMSQQLMQQILGAGQSGFGQLTGTPQQLLQLRLAALGINPLNNATTTSATQTNNPGWGAMFGNLLGAAGNMFSFSPISLGGGR